MASSLVEFAPVFARPLLSGYRPARLGLVALALLSPLAAMAQTATQPATPAATAPQAAMAQPAADAAKPTLDKNGLPTTVVKAELAPKDPDAIAPPHTDGPVDEIIVTAPQFNNREEIDAFHKAEFERLDKIYGKHDPKQYREDILTKAPEANTGTTRDGPITLDR